MRAQPRRAARRDTNEAAIIRGLEQCGYKVWQLNSWVDLLVYRADCKLRVLEVKNPDKPPSKRRLTPTEKEFLVSVGACGGVVLTLEEALELLRV